MLYIIACYMYCRYSYGFETGKEDFNEKIPWQYHEIQKYHKKVEMS